MEDRNSSTRDFGARKFSVLVEIDCSNVQRLMQITDEVRQQEQRFAFVGKPERWRRWPSEQDRDRCVDGRDDIVVVDALKVPIEMVALDCHVIEVVGVVATHLFLVLAAIVVFSLRQIAALEEVALDVLLHDGMRRGEGLARSFISFLDDKWNVPSAKR